MKIPKPVAYLLNKKLLYTVAGLVICFIFLNNLVLPWYVNHGETQPVPSVIGMTLNDARKSLESVHLVAVEAETRADPQTPAGCVVAQNPEPDALVKSGRRVYLTISGGEALVSVPALKGRSLRDAKFTLERNSLKIGDVQYTTSDAYPAGTIVDQSVQPGIKVSKNSLVGLFVSQGKEIRQITVPDFTGRTLTEAQRLISQQGLTLGNITYQASFDLIPNTVVDQFPRGGELVAQGQSIDLFVIKAGKPKEEIERGGK